MKGRRGLIRWIKNHKNELVIAGISIAALITLVLGLKNQEAIKSLWSSLQGTIKQPMVNAPKKLPDVTIQIKPEPIQVSVPSTGQSDTHPYEVSQHIRNLRAGHHASPEKIASAAEKDIVLMDGQTWVKSFMKGGAAA